MKGDCFRAAWRLMVDLGPNDGLRLVHGLVVGAKGKVKGRRFPHAWVELNQVVLDYSNGRKFIVRRAAYYAAGKVSKTVKYTYRDGIRKACRFKHYGPWKGVK